MLNSLTRATLSVIGLLSFIFVAPAFAQWKPWHYQHYSTSPPGAVGTDQLTHGGPRAGYFQPVKIHAPEGVSISLIVDDKFERPQAAPITVGMLIGQVYRMKVTGIPLHEGFEVYPSIEVINRLYPPPGQEARFPIPVELTVEELDMAMRGGYVTRVIYLEEPTTALPLQQIPGQQRYFEVLPTQDPLIVADRLGRPMAILRIGSRLPEANGASPQFMFGSPQLVKLPKPGPDASPEELKTVEPDARQPDAAMLDAMLDGQVQPASFTVSADGPSELSPKERRARRAQFHMPGRFIEMPESNPLR